MRISPSSQALLRSGLTTALVLLPLIAVTEVLRLVNLAGTPARGDDEGAVMAAAYSILHFSDLSPYSFWYDHQPLGALQVAGWLGLSEAFWGSPDDILTGRRFMVLIAVGSAVLLWLLVRRLGYSRFAAGGAVALLALSPLAIQTGRPVLLDNLAILWVLAAAVCVCTPKRRLGAYLGAAVCFTVAVLTVESMLLFLPALAWLAWQRGDKGTRRYAMVASGTLFGLLFGAYVAIAAVRSELLPNAAHPGLLDGLTFQVFSRPSGGAIWTAGSTNQQILLGWLGLDAILLGAGLAGAVIALFVRGLRPLAVGFLLLGALVLIGGTVPSAYVVVLLPLAALLAATVAEEAYRNLAATEMPRKVVAIAVLVAVVGAAGLAVPVWHGTLEAQSTTDRDATMRQAQRWITDNISREDRLLVDAAQLPDLLEAGWKRDNVTWFNALDTDPALRELNPAGFRDYDYLVVTRAVREGSANPQIAAALNASVVVATFGTTDRVDIRRIDHAAAAASPGAEPERATVGAALVTRLGDGTPKAVQDLMKSGRVDSRVLATLSDLNAVVDLTVADLPEIAGEDAKGGARRAVRIIGGGAERALAYYKAQKGAFVTESVTAGADGVLVTFPPATTSSLLAAAVSPPADGPAAAVRVINLSPELAAGRVQFAGINGTAVAPLGTAGYAKATGYAAVPSGVTTIGIGPTDPAQPTSLMQVVALAPERTYTLMLFSSPDGKVVRGQLVPDPAAAAPSGRTLVRLVNAARTPDLSVSAVGGASPLARKVSYGLVTGYLDLPAGTIPMSLTAGAVRTDANVELKSGHVQTLVVVEIDKGPLLVPIEDPTRTPETTPLENRPAARPGVLAPVAQAVPAPPALTSKNLGYAPAVVLAFGIVLGAVAFLQRRRRGPVAAAVSGRPVAGAPVAARPPMTPPRAAAPVGDREHTVRVDQFAPVQRPPQPGPPATPGRGVPVGPPGPRPATPPRGNPGVRGGNPAISQSGPHPQRPPAPNRGPNPMGRPPAGPPPAGPPQGQPQRGGAPQPPAGRPPMPPAPRGPAAPRPQQPPSPSQQPQPQPTSQPQPQRPQPQPKRPQPRPQPPQQPVAAAEQPAPEVSEGVPMRTAPSPADVDPTVYLGSISKLRKAASMIRAAEAEDPSNDSLERPK